ncbi:MAG: GNAT family N-acetyltransferase, partial [Lachnospiraceae bacterium]|nr:GNAT family N-acetyltransferase [Lachnospiraceae bacterium]
VEQQKLWIRKQREKVGDYFFVVWDKEGKRIGTISIYDVNGGHAESGRLAIKGDNAFQGIEAQILSFRFAFGSLRLEYVDGYIFADNERAIRFNKQFGGRQLPPKEDDEGRKIIKFENWREDFEKVDKKLSSILYRKNKE